MPSLEVLDTDNPLWGMTTCDNCDSLLRQDEALIVQKHVGRTKKSFHFCGEGCANHYYLEMLREGM